MKKKLIIILPIIIAALAFVFVYRYYNKEDANTTLTVTEKKWVQDNKEKQYDNKKNIPAMPSSLSNFIFDAARTEGSKYG